ncbi:DNA-binding transcriptional activator of the SARP family [Pseudonocardia thermophila]|uniref:DNA-binding transcriptional activator of the SARP family n=1 Tax=Pseudonocardia thermophila TaxID=1848 RepID=A0A1M6NL25_PSETH|nr:BTAD domain-containing putative transcriptional regulator [Pseudonocardia thermophila]SHJ96400.1 DNA-binding transcriptional activator of the SARP family [Pseudonocardia thermophila]
MSVLGSFELTVGGESVTLGVDARRLVAYLAVHPRPQPRPALAGDLWPGVPADAALKLLDEAVESVDVPGLLADIAPGEIGEGPLELAPAVEVDLADAMGLIRALPEIPTTDKPDVSPLTVDILPGWTAAWVAVERERYRQLRLHALEERSMRLSAEGRAEEAVELARHAVRAAPSRESARRALVEALLAEGDVTAAVAEYDEYQELLRSSLGPASNGLDNLLPPTPAWPVLRARHPMPRSAVQLPRLPGAGRGGSRRLVSGGSVPGSFR